MKRLLLLAIVGASTVAILAGFGFGPRHGGRMDPAKMEKYLNFRLNDMLDDINATPAQRATVMSVKDRLLPEARAMFADKAQRYAEVKQLWLDQNPDPKVVHAKVDQRIDEMRTLAHKFADGILEIQRALTPEQRAQLAEKAEEHHKGMNR